MTQPPLHPQLEFALKKPARGFAGLHQVLTGPPASGKTVQGKEYAMALAARGLVKSLHFLVGGSISSDMHVAEVDNIFARAKGGVLVIDEFEHAAQRGVERMAERIAAAVENGDSVIVLTGSAAGLRKLLEENQRLRTLLPLAIELARSFTAAEQEAYDEQTRGKPDFDDVRRSHDDRMAEWRQARDEDLRPQTGLATPKTARFAKKPVLS